MVRTRRPTTALILLALLTACAPDEAESNPDRDRAGDPAASLVIRETVEHTGGTSVREPMVVEHPDGTLFVSGYTRDLSAFETPPLLYRSTDGGANWEAVNVGSAEDGAVGNSDVDLAVGPDGTLYFLTMGFDRAVSRGTHVAVGVSRDVGETWAWTELSRTDGDDRPWISIAPNGDAHVVWNDGGGVHHAVSWNAGRSWEERPSLHPLGGSSHLAIGHEGEIAVRIMPLSASGNRYDPGVDFVGISGDGGSTWKVTVPPGRRIWDPAASGPDVVPRWVEPVAWDEDLSLYTLWSEGTEMWLARSLDLGESWESWVIESGEQSVYHPFVATGGPGLLAATWFSGEGDALRANVRLIDVAGGRPSVRRAEALPVDSWREIDGRRQADPAGEYFPVVFLADGDLGVVLPIQSAPQGDGFAWFRITR